MKKLLIIAMVAVFAISFVAGITSAKNKPDPGTLFCAFVSCDHEHERVLLNCVNPKNGKTFFVWSDDPVYFERWCQ